MTDSYPWKKSWHGSVGYTLTDRYGAYCGYIGLAYGSESYEDGVQQGLAWLRRHMPSKHYSHLVHSFTLEVKYF